MRTLVIRADSTVEIGTGHIMRCIALAQAWQDVGGDVIFICAQLTPELEFRLHNEKIIIYCINSLPGSNEDALDTISYAKRYGAKWVVVDGYHFSVDYQKSIKAAKLSLLFVDDNGDSEHYYADIILNQNIFADCIIYRSYEPYTVFLLGPKFALLRREFLKWSGWNRETPKVAQKILITLGGSDPDNVTCDVIEILKMIDIKSLEIIVVIGGANPHYNLIFETVKGFTNIKLEKNTENMPDLMAWADIAISGGGSTCIELMYMGLPSCILLMAENQVQNVKSLEKKHAIIFLGNAKTFNKKRAANTILNLIQNRSKREKMSEISKKQINYDGTLKIISNLLNK